MTTATKKALVIANSILPNERILQKCLSHSDTVICADGGANRALDRGIVPDIVLGDFDSVSTHTQLKLTQTEFIHVPDQHMTDLEKTLNFLVAQNIPKAILIGISGLRLDHQIGNLNIVQKFIRRIEMEIIDDYGVGSFIWANSEPITYEFHEPINTNVSLLAFTVVEKVTTQGLKYPLNQESLEWAIRDGMSNKSIECPFRITIQGGNLFTFRTYLES